MKSKSIQLLIDDELAKYRIWVREVGARSKVITEEMERLQISNYALYYMYVKKIPIPKTVARANRMPSDTITKDDEKPYVPKKTNEVANMPAKKKTNKKNAKKRGEKTALIKKLINEAKLTVAEIADKADSTVLAVRTTKYNMNKNGELSAAAKKAPRANKAKKAAK